MAQKVVIWRKSTSKTGKIGMSCTTYNEDNTIDNGTPVLYCAGATSEQEALAMVASVGKTAFIQETVNDTTGQKLISIQSGTVKTLDVAGLLAKTSGGSRADRIKAAYDSLKGNSQSAIEEKINQLQKQAETATGAKKTQLEKEIAKLELSLN